MLSLPLEDSVNRELKRNLITHAESINCDPSMHALMHHALEMQLLWLTKSSQDSFLHMRPILCNVERGNLIKFWQNCIISGTQDDLKNLKMGKYGYFGDPEI